jgi:hypothetical protein
LAGVTGQDETNISHAVWKRQSHAPRFLRK